MTLRDSEMRSINDWCKQVVEELTQAEIGPFRKDFKNTISSICIRILAERDIPCKGFENALAMQFLMRRLYEYFIRNQSAITYEDDPEHLQREMAWFLIHTIDDKERKTMYWNYLIHQKKATDAIASEKMLHYVKKTDVEQQLLLANELLRSEQHTTCT